jgi:hypothetical protein
MLNQFSRHASQTQATINHVRGVAQQQDASLGSTGFSLCLVFAFTVPEISRTRTEYRPLS